MAHQNQALSVYKTTRRNTMRLMGNTLVPTGLLLLALLSHLFISLKVLLILCAIVILQYKRLFRIIDLNFFLLLLFLVVYSINNLFADRNADNISLALILFPCLLYGVGRWLGNGCKSGGHYLNILICLSISLASVALISIFLSIISYGYSGLSRTIELIGGTDEISATVLGGFLVLINALSGMLFEKQIRCGDLYRKAFIFFFLSLSVVAALRLGSRTQLLILLACACIGIFLNRKQLSAISKTLIGVVALLLIYVVASAVDDNALLLTYFQDRISDSSASVASAGGRSERWGNSIELLATSPTGWEFHLVGYAHNFWLDAARNGGWIGYFTLVLFTVSALRTTVHAIRRNASDKQFVSATICITSGFYMLFAVEPILDGFIYAFGAYCAILGMISTTSCRSVPAADRSTIRSTRMPAKSGMNDRVA